MLTLWGSHQRNCDGINRRQFLQVGALGLGGLSLANLLRLEARAAQPARKKSIIYVVLSGGPSHIDMYDMKPEADIDIRGPFKPISTRLTGVQICEHMPRQAEIMDQLTLLRGIQSVENDHFLSEVYTGLPRTAGRRPAFGSIVSRLRDRDGSLPPYVSLERPSTDEFNFQKPYYAGAAHRPFHPFGESLDNLRLSKGITLDRLQDRKQLLKDLDSIRRDMDQRGEIVGMDRYGQQALDMITSDQVRDAFDLRKEPDRVVARYGKGKYTHQTVKNLYYDFDAKQFLLARRLVEAGVRVVTLSVSQWDHHSGASSDIFHSLGTMLPALDASLAALIADLRERGLDKDVLVVVLGEFGRTPKIVQPGPGREHHADAGCAILYGGGLKMGQVIGATDRNAERAKSGKIGFQNIMATMYQVLGIDPSQQLIDFNGRPQFILDDRDPIAELIA
ncbi:MAG: DUF1501 domain-containing protein [Gemmataceae bacterium]|nr:DUF1501 domain-containing protein [Gemmataceae bacterium]